MISIFPGKLIVPPCPDEGTFMFIAVVQNRILCLETSEKKLYIDWVGRYNISELIRLGWHEI